MKYLKLYEELGNEVLFSEITQDEWNGKFILRVDYNYEDFSHSEIKGLKEYFEGWDVVGPYGNSLKNYPNWDGVYTLNFAHPVRVKQKNDGGFGIIKSIDEWYYVGDFQNRRSYKYYKCDTFDGLMQCLNHCRF